MFTRRKILQGGIGGALGMLLVSLGIRPEPSKVSAEEIPWGSTTYNADGETVEANWVADHPLADTIKVSLHSTPYDHNYSHRWVGEDGTLFQVEALDQVDENFEYLYKAYPKWDTLPRRLLEKTPTLYVPFYMKHTIRPYFMELVASASYDYFNEDYMPAWNQNFEAAFFEKVGREGYLTTALPFDTVYSTPKENSGWGVPTERSSKALYGAELGGTNG